MNRQRSAHPWPRPHRIAAVALAVSLALVDTEALALGFGEPQVASALGQPLRMRIPLHVDGDLEVTSQCVRLIGASAGDTLPTLSQARLTIEEHGAERALRIDSLLPVSEPILRVTVEGGCLQRVRREFVILLDPPESATPNIVAGPVIPLLPSGEPAPATAASSQPPGTTPAGSTGPGDIGLGIARVDGRVGEPLTMQIPVSGPGAASVAPGCVHLADALSGDGAPVLNQANLSLGHVDGQTTINLVTPDRVMEPALRVILEVGCDVPLRREYGVLLDNSALPAPPAPINPIATATPAPAPAAAPQAAAAPAAASNTGEALPAAIAETTAPSASPAEAPKPRRKPHKSSLASVKPTPAPAPDKLPAAPTVPPLAAAQPEPAPAQAPAAPAAAKPAAASKGAKAPETDHLTLSAPDDQATAAALKIAEMDKRVEELTKEVSQLRAELATERQSQADSSARQQRGGLGWVVAALSLLGLAVGGVLVWQRSRASGTWHGGSWNDADVGPETRSSTTTMKVDTVTAVLPPTPRPVFGSVPSVPPRTIVPPPTTVPPPVTTTAGPRTTRPGGPLQEVEVETSPGSMDITELQHNEPSLEKLRTLFNDVNEGPANSPEDEVISGLGRLTVPLDMPLSPTETPLVPPPTVMQPAERGATFTFEEAPLTQTPTLVALDLDLTTRVTPGGGNTVQLDDGEAGKAAGGRDTPNAPGSNSKH